MKNIHVAAHTHWDREWYFTVRDSYVLLCETFKRVVEQLESNELDSFCLDAQSSICEDFLNFHPEYTSRVEKLIAEKRLFVGPWHTQTDCLYVSGDSIVHNLVYGKNYANKLGHSMNVAYLPDTFGFNIQMPTIVRNCNIDNILIRRGVDYDNHSTESYFNWKGISEDRVVAAHLYKGYGEMGQLFHDEAKEEKLINYADTICKFTSSQDILVETGGDQTEINRTLGEDIKKYKKLVTKYNLLNSNLERFFDSIKDNDLNDYTSDFRIGSYDRVHRTIGGIRYDIKQQNYLAENKIFNLTLPLMLIAKEHNIEISHILIDTCFKKLFENQAHDSMGGCVTDEVYEDIMYRFREVNEILDGINNTIAYRIHELGHYSENEIIVFNTSTRKSTTSRIIDVLSYDKNITLNVDATIVKCNKVNDNSVQGFHYAMSFEISESIPALGYLVISTISSEETEVNEKNISMIENNVLKIYFDETLNLEYNGKVIKDFISILDMGNEGDTYDFSYITGEKECEFSFTDIEFKQVEKKYIAIAKLDLELPTNLDARINNTNETTINNIELHLEVMQDSDVIDAKIKLDNQSLSHRMRVKFKTGSTSTEHIASVPFGFIYTSDNEENIESWQSAYQEENVNVKVLDNLVSKQNESFYLNVLSHGQKEYEMVNGDIVVTLLATTGEFGRANLNTRPGRASGDTSSPGHKMIFTPQAQHVGENNFHFSIKLSQIFEENYFASFIQEMKTPQYSYQRQKIDKFAKRLDNKMFPIFPEKNSHEKFSLFELDLNVSYVDYIDGAYIVRIVNSTKEAIDITDKLTGKFSEIVKLYATGEPFEISDCSIGAYSFTTFRLKV